MIKTVKFTECLETTLRVQNFRGKFQGGTIGRISRLRQLTVLGFGLLEKCLKRPPPPEIGLGKKAGGALKLGFNTLIGLLY